MVQISQLMIRHKHGEDIYPTKTRQTAWDTFWQAVEDTLCQDLNYDDPDDAEMIDDIQDMLEDMQAERHDLWFAADGNGNFEHEEFHIEFEAGDFFTCVWYETEMFMPVPDMPGFRQHSSVVDYETKAFLTFLISLKYAKMTPKELELETEAIIILDNLLRDEDFKATMEATKVYEQPEAYAALQELWNAAKAAHDMGYHYLWLTLSDDVDLSDLVEDGSINYRDVLIVANKATNFNFMPARVIAANLI